MKFITQTKFWQAPFVLTLIAFWFFILGVYRIWKIITPCVGVKCEIEICSTLWSLISVFIYFGIAIGLVKRNNNSREWAIFFISFGVLGITLILAIVVFENPNSIGGFQINFNRLSRPQVIIALVAFLALHVGMLFTLMKSATKIFFIPQTKQEDK